MNSFFFLFKIKMVKSVKNNYLINLLSKQYGDKLTEKILNSYKMKRYSTLRVNTLKATKEEIMEVFKENKIHFTEVNWYKSAFIINEENVDKIRNLDIYKNGKIYFQSLSSMIPVLILNPKEKEDILDMAAAPGSKTSQIAMETNNNSYITAVEKNKIRLDRLKYNLNKLGVNCCNVLNIDARNIDTMFSFDKVLLDAPCSGSGTINIENINDDIFSKERIDKIVTTQIDLLRKALQILKPGNLMVYSTCSILNLENENVINTLKEEIDFEIIPITLDKNIPLLPVNIQGTICICPNEYYEGFFVALIKKK